MLVEGTYFKEVIYTTGLFGAIVCLGLMAQKFGWGEQRRAAHLAHHEKSEEFI